MTVLEIFSANYFMATGYFHFVFDIKFIERLMHGRIAKFVTKLL